MVKIYEMPGLEQGPTTLEDQKFNKRPGHLPHSNNYGTYIAGKQCLRTRSPFRAGFLQIDRHVSEKKIAVHISHYL